MRFALRDLYDLATTPGPSYVRGMGYLSEAIDMRGRYRRRQDAWRPHLERTRRFVLEAAEQCTGRGRVVVLGSGLLLDVPLAELCSLFREVVLKDIVCLPGVRKQIERHPNARFEQHDATGVAERLYANGRRSIQTLPDLHADNTAKGDPADLVVSLNILSQLGVVPRAYIGRTFRGITPEQADDWCGRIVEAHYASLRALSCPACIVADHAFVKRDAGGAVVSRDSTVHGLALPAPDDAWTWDIVPRDRDSPHTSKELLVGAWSLS